MLRNSQLPKCNHNSMEHDKLSTINLFYFMTWIRQKIMKDKSCWASQKFEAPNHKRRFVKSMLYKAI